MSDAPAASSDVHEVEATPPAEKLPGTEAQAAEKADAVSGAQEANQSPASVATLPAQLDTWRGVAKGGEYRPIGRRKIVDRWSGDDNERPGCSRGSHVYLHVRVHNAANQEVYLSPGDVVVLRDNLTPRLRTYVGAIARTRAGVSLLLSSDDDKSVEEVDPTLVREKLCRSCVLDGPQLDELLGTWRSSAKASTNDGKGALAGAGWQCSRQ